MSRKGTGQALFIGLGSVTLALGFGFMSLHWVSADGMSSQGSVSTWGMGARFGVKAREAEKLMRRQCANSKVVVAVVDTGLDVAHPDLKNSLWKNPKEIMGNGQDDDRNGYVDDMHGWDFATNSGRIIDRNGHGTHISGIIAASGAGANSYRGVCPGAKIMSIRYYNEQASGLQNLQNSIKALRYAIDNGATIINYSGGGNEPSEEELKALKLAESKGILVVAAAGNERSNADEKKYFPASYGLSNTISVAAIDSTGQMIASSNWGQRYVHIAAPGNAILSTFPGGSYSFLTGTSQATAFVSGLAAMLMSENPKLTIAQVKSVIESTGNKHVHLLGKTKTAAVVDAARAIQAVQTQVRTVSSDLPTDRFRSLFKLNQ